MKAIRCYLIDNDLTELCESQSKNLFVRYWVYNGYAYSWTKWQSMGQLKNIKKYLCIWENLNGNEIKQRKIELEFSNREKFSIMLKDKQLVKNFRCRLPF